MTIGFGGVVVAAVTRVEGRRRRRCVETAGRRQYLSRTVNQWSHRGVGVSGRVVILSHDKIDLRRNWCHITLDSRSTDAVRVPMIFWRFSYILLVFIVVRVCILYIYTLFFILFFKPEVTKYILFGHYTAATAPITECWN